MKNDVTEKFLRYVGFDTQSEQDAKRFPSTEKQLALMAQLKKEMLEMGIADAATDDWGYTTGTLPATDGGRGKTIGFLAHVDTSPAVSGANVKPRIVENYDGGEILLNEKERLVLSPAQYPELSGCRGQDVIVTDGTTLLGADDKAGVAEIMSMAQHLLEHPEIKHGKLRLGFTPDEEVGCGVDHFDVERFGADYAYTVDGGDLGGIDYENFNAASGIVEIRGRSIHPGSAKGQMVNAVRLAEEFDAMLPPDEKPEYTEGYEGFYHLDGIEGNVERAMMGYIIRDHDAKKFGDKKAYFQRVGDYLNAKYGEGTFTLTVKDSYYNMAEKIKPHFHLVESAEKAFADCGVEPVIRPIRGGTDGSRLSYMGLPCPNLSTGGHNFHGRYEYITCQAMQTMVRVLTRLAQLYSGK